MAPGNGLVAQARSLLFVPGTRPERFDKAAASGADLVVLDLEDAVRPDDRQTALGHVVAWLANERRTVVRVNAVGTPWHEAEVAALTDLTCGVMVPKAEDAEAMAHLVRQLGGPLVALVETARGVQNLESIAAVPGLERIALGTIDLAAELGIDPSNRAALDYTRSRLVVASAAAGLPAPIDGVTTALDAPEVLASDTRAARDLGFGGKLCIHPRQVEIVHEALRPTEHEIGWAERVMATASTGGVAVVDGGMVDAPVVTRARAILARARLSR